VTWFCLYGRPVPKDESVAPDPNVACQLAVPALFDAHIYQGILPKCAFRVQVGCQKATVSIEGDGRGQTAHVGAGHYMVQKLINVGDACVHSHLKHMS
jgi:hypothetical protein